MSGDDAPKPDDVDPPSDGRDIAREEARQVIEIQLQTLRDTDQKAQFTARIVAIVLGLVVSGVSFADDPSLLAGPFMVAGVASFVGSLSVAVMTYSVDRASYGIGPGYIDTTLSELETAEELEDDLLSRYADWMDDNSAELSTNAGYLLLSQLLFIAGILLFGHGVYRLV